MRPPARVRALALLLLTLLAAVLIVETLLEPRRHDHRTSQVIYPGHEAQVMAFLAPLRRGFVGLTMEGVSIRSGEIRVQLTGPAPTAPPCALPPWAHSPGALIITNRPGGVDEAFRTDQRGGHAARGGLRLDWCVGGPAQAVDHAARSLTEELAALDRRGVWGAWGGAPLRGRRRGQGPGLLAPLASWISLAPQTVSVLALTTALACTLALGLWLRSRRPGPVMTEFAGPGSFRHAWIIALAVLALGAWLRLRAAHAPLDGDELWSYPLPHPTYMDDHDAWVHPPAHRVLQQAWVRASRWHRGDPLASLRSVSVAAALLSLGVLGAGAFARRRGPTALLVPLAVVPVALAAVVVEDVTLARPYALAALLVVVTAAALWWPDEEDTASWPLALLAGGLAAWTDLLAGLAAAVVITVALVSSTMSRGSRVLVLLVLAAWMAPLAPGAWEAAHVQLHPMLREGSADGPDLRPDRGLGRGHAPQVAGEIASLTLFGQRGRPVALVALVALALAVCAWRSRGAPRTAPLSLALVVLLVSLLSTRVALRTRNVLFLPHLAAAAMIAVLGRTAPRRAHQEGASPKG